MSKVYSGEQTFTQLRRGFSHASAKKSKQKGLRVWNFALLLVIFKWHDGSKGVKVATLFFLCLTPLPFSVFVSNAWCMNTFQHACSSKDWFKSVSVSPKWTALFRWQSWNDRLHDHWSRIYTHGDSQVMAEFSSKAANGLLNDAFGYF